MPILIRRAGAWVDTLTGAVVGTVTPPSATVTSIVTSNDPSAANPRDSLVPGAYTVDATTTGVRPGRTMTITTTHVPASNTDYFDLDIRNMVDFFGKTNVRYFDCYFRGANTRPAGASGLATLHRAHGRGHVFTDCTFLPQLPDFRWVGCQGFGFTVRRCDFSILCDPFEVFIATTSGQPSVDGPVDVDIQTSYLHDQACFWPSGSVPITDVKWGGGESSPDGSHSDDMQWEGGTGLIFKYNNCTGLVAPQYAPRYGQGGNQSNCCMTIFPDVGAISGADIRFNDFWGGSVPINVGDKPAKGRFIANLGLLQNNTFHGGQFFPPTDVNIISSTSLNPGGVQVNLGSGSTANTHVNGSAIVVTRSTTTP